MWSTGVILFYFLTGKTPFHADSVAVLFAQIRHSLYLLTFLSPLTDSLSYSCVIFSAARYVYPEYLTENAKDLISKILILDPQQVHTHAYSTASKQTHIHTHTHTHLTLGHVNTCLSPTRTQYVCGCVSYPYPCSSQATCVLDPMQDMCNSLSTNYHTSSKNRTYSIPSTSSVLTHVLIQL